MSGWAWRAGTRRTRARTTATMVVVAWLLTVGAGAAAAADGDDDDGEQSLDYPAPAPPPPAPLRPVSWDFELDGPDGSSLAGRELHRGETFTLRATGLPAGSNVVVDLHSNPIRLGAASIGDDGALDLEVTVPEEAETGAHTVNATLSGFGLATSTASVGVTVADEPYDWLSPTVPTPGQLELTPFKVAVTASLASAFLLLAAIPAELLQSTLTENYSRAFGWLGPLARRRRRVHLPRALGRPWIACGVTVALATLILGFGQTGWHLQSESLITFASLFLSLTALNLGLGAGRLVASKRMAHTPGRMMPLPGALIVVAVSVVISEVLRIEPALLFGAVVTVQYGRSLSRRHEGRLALIGVSTAFAMGVGSWLALGALETVFAESDSVVLLLTEETLAGIVLETLAALVVGLLPFTYLDGKAIHDWHRRIWGATYFVAAAAFVLIVVPTGDTWQESQTPLLTWLIIVAGFGTIALAAWAAFRLTPEHASHPEPRADDRPPPQPVDA